MKAGQDVIISQPLYDGMSWLPDEKWMKLKGFKWWQLSDGVYELRLRWVKPKGDHVHQGKYRLWPWPQTQCLHLSLHPYSLLLGAVPPCNILIVGRDGGSKGAWQEALDMAELWNTNTVKYYSAYTSGEKIQSSLLRTSTAKTVWQKYIPSLWMVSFVAFTGAIICDGESRTVRYKQER